MRFLALPWYPFPMSEGDRLIQLIDRWTPRRVIVVGDFMLDHYVYGSANRLSPDAPVPVLSVQREEDRPGGASNVCLALAALNCNVLAFGVVGADDTADRLKRQLEDRGCDVAGLVAADDGRPTTIKQNFVGLAQHRHPQKMFRVDHEQKGPVSPAVEAAIAAKIESLLAAGDVLCIEDYDKGVCTKALCQRLIAAAKAAGAPVLVDPAAIDDYAKYRGATCITPNRTEARLACGEDVYAELNAQPDATSLPERMATRLLDDLDLQAIVLTLDKEGALLLERDQQAALLPTQARAVYDVTGAGDTVLAMLAAAIANGADWPDAVRLANVAAGLEVERFGVVAIELHEVLMTLWERRRELHGKVRELDALAPELEAHRRDGKRIVFTNGCFDILHAGHVMYLREARRLGDLMVVALNSDASITRLKGAGRPVNQLDDRLVVMSELESVDYLIVFEDDTPERLLHRLRPDVLAKGGDYSKDQVVGRSIVEDAGGEVVVLQQVEGRSTTNIIQKMSQQSG